jgi:hypothetical protein
MVLLVVLLVATQAVVNLFSDWNKEELNYSSDDLDEEEIERIRAQVGTDGGAAGYVTDQPNLAKD